MSLLITSFISLLSCGDSLTVDTIVSLSAIFSFTVDAVTLFTSFASFVSLLTSFVFVSFISVSFVFVSTVLFSLMSLAEYTDEFTEDIIRLLLLAPRLRFVSFFDSFIGIVSVFCVAVSFIASIFSLRTSFICSFTVS